MASGRHAHTPDRPKIALKLEGISKTYHSESGANVPVLAALDLAVAQGEVVTVIGPTGCGKTTLLNIIAGLDSADSGTVRLGGGLRPGQNIPCVFQHYTLFPWRTILRNITFGLEMRHTPRAERRTKARELLSKVGLQGFERAYPHELSGGMRQRAAVAQALAVEPPLLLMDEPFGALDEATRTGLQQTVSALWQDTAMTVVFVTHNIDEAIAMGNRVLVFSERPSRIAAQFEVDLPRPRDHLSPDFTDLFIRIRQSLPRSAA